MQPKRLSFPLRGKPRGQACHLLPSFFGLLTAWMPLNISSFMALSTDIADFAFLFSVLNSELIGDLSSRNSIGRGGRRGQNSPRPSVFFLLADSRTDCKRAVIVHKFYFAGLNKSADNCVHVGQKVLVGVYVVGLFQYRRDLLFVQRSIFPRENISNCVSKPELFNGVFDFLAAQSSKMHDVVLKLIHAPLNFFAVVCELEKLFLSSFKGIQEIVFIYGLHGNSYLLKYTGD